MFRTKSRGRRNYNFSKHQSWRPRLEQLEDRRLLAITLPPSTFEIDGDKAANNGGIDWTSAAVTSSITYILKDDRPTGPTDDALGQGSKEDKPAITVVTGTIPNSKADLRDFLYFSQAVGGQRFLNLGWDRWNTSGTTNFDFEFNQHPTVFPTGDFKAVKVQVNRAAGDFLITYDFQGGANIPTLAFRRWVAESATTGHWTDPTYLTGPNAPSQNLALAAVSAGDSPLFGEACINLTAAGIDATIGQAWVRSRSSSAFTSEIKDIIAPAQIQIAGTKFNDLNGNGTQDAGELGLPNWTIFLDTNQNGVLNAGELSTTTDASGNYLFDHLEPGTYYVAEVRQAGWRETFPNAGTSGAQLTPAGTYEWVLLNLALSHTDRDFGNQALSRIGGTKFEDVDGNGTQGAGEDGLPNWTIFLDTNQDGDLDAGEVSKTTDANGEYSFDNLVPGTYTVAELIPPAPPIWLETFPSALSADPTILTAAGTYAWVVTISGSAPAVVIRDFGNQEQAEPAPFGGLKFLDRDGDGTQAADEPGLGGWTIQLYDDNNSSGTLDGPDTLRDVTTTSSNPLTLGEYLFAGPEIEFGGSPIKLIVHEVQQPGYIQTVPSTDYAVTVSWVSTLHPVVTSVPGGAPDNLDFGNFLVDAQIDIVKDTFDGNTNVHDCSTILAGEAIHWQYLVTNPGNVPLSSVTVTDDQGVTPVFQSGDADNDDELDPGETWIYTAAGIAQVGSYSNIGTATGTAPFSTPTASDASSYFGADAQIAINKITIDGAASGDGITVQAGDAIAWQYSVTNPGNEPLSSVTVTDDQGVAPVFQSGDADNDDELDPGETWIYTASGTAVAGSYSNTGTATGSFTDTAGHTSSPTASDASSYFGADAQIAINKITIDGAASGDGITVQAGDAIAWQYSVTNPGNEPLSSVTVTDDQGVAPVFQSGDTDNDDELDPGETWIYTASGTAVAGSYSNTGTATGSFTDTAGHTSSPTASDASSYFGADAQIAINKITIDGAASGDGITVQAGDAIAWQYSVTNPGNEPLSSVTVTDDQGVAPVFQSGDADNDDELDPGETWIYTASGTAVAGSYSNTGTATGSFTDTAGHTSSPTASDASSYFGADAQIAINKITIDGAASGDGITVQAGDAIAWQYSVTNPGNEPLSSVTVTDDQGVAPVFQSGDADNDDELDPGETWIYTASGTAVAGSYSNTGTATGSFTDTAGHTSSPTASDASSYFGADAQIAINKITIDGAASGDGITVQAGDAIAWQYSVTNPGNEPLSSVTVTDDQGVAPVFQSGDADNDDELDPGETWIYTASGTAVAGSYSNTGTATGSFTDTAGHTSSPTASDASSYFGADAQIAINKITIDGAASGDGITVQAGDAIAWQYSVTNPGNEPLSSVTVTDDQGVAPVFQSGDADNDDELDPGETWIYTASGTAVAGSYSNTGTATGSFTDTAGHTSSPTASDASSYFGADAQIAINKITIDGAASGDGITVQAGDAIAWQYSVTNPGNEPLSSVTVTDDQGVAPVFQSGDADNDDELDPGETWIYTASGTAVAGSYSNTGTATGSFTDTAGHTSSPTASDASSYFGADAQIAINKITIDGAASGDGITVQAGDAIAWQYSVTNPGNEPLSSVTVTDDQGVAPVFQSGDADNDDELDPGETWIYTASGTAVAGSYSNTGTATGSFTDTAGHTSSPTASDASSYFGADAQIAINKITIDGAASGDGITVQAGDAIAWQYSVTNPGNEPLSSVTVTDDQGVAPVFQSGDADNDDELDPGETWIYTASGTAVAGSYSNTGTATGSFTDTAGHTSSPTASDASSYFGADAQIAINKITIDGAASGDGITVQAGDAIAWQYSVTNPGNEPLSSVTVTDDQGVTPVFQSGDADNDDELDPGETWIYTASGTAVAGSYSNTGTATGSFTDTAGHTSSPTASDASSYFGADAQIAINKITIDGAASGDGITVQAGDAIAWQYSVTNPGNEPLSSVTVTDDQGVAPVFQSGDTDNDDELDPGETWIYTASGTAVAGSYSNTGTATGSFTDTAGHTSSPTASDASSYFGADAQIAINKITIDGAASGDGITVQAGDAIAWQYSVTNPGNEPLSSVTVTDDQGVAPVFQSGDADNDDELDPGETWIYTASGTAVAGSYSNTGTATGSFTDTAGHTSSPTASDASSYFGADAQIAINKITIDGAASGDGITVQAGDAIAWQYSVTNPGNEPLSSVTVTDDQGVAPVFQSGDADNDDELDPGETWIYTASGTAVAGSYSNTGTATGSFTDTAGHTSSPTASDASSYFGADAQIAINKITIDGAASGDGITVQAGDAIAWQYSVTNPGNEPLSSVTVTDDQGVAPVFQSGDTDNDDELDPGETWIYTASGTAVAGSYSNTGTATGSFTDTAGHTSSPTASDASSYFGADAQIAINKITIDGAASGDGITVQAGDAIAWQYSVTNPGNEPLSSVTVTDDQGVAPVFQSGDADNDDELDPGETWIYTASGTAVAGSYSNTGTATGSFTDTAGHTSSPTASDASSYFGADAQIAINKITIDGAASGDGITVQAGDAIAWQYSVTNPGNEPLSSVTVTDDQGVAPVFQSGDADNDDELDPGETWIYTASGTAVAGSYSNTGTATGSFTDTAGHTSSPTASDPSSYLGVTPNLVVTKTADSEEIVAPGTAGYTITVSNTGAGTAFGVDLDDDLPDPFNDDLNPIDLLWTVDGSPPGSGGITQGNNGSDHLHWEIGNLAGDPDGAGPLLGGSFTIHVSADIPASYTALPLDATPGSGPLGGDVNLPPSAFEIDGDKPVNHGGIDWGSVAASPHYSRQEDLSKSQDDDSLGQGSKEDDIQITVVTGSIPNSKADLTESLFYSETLEDPVTHEVEIVLNLGWSRADQSGTVNFDFEINQEESVIEPGPVTLNRTVGDLLIIYNFDAGNNRVNLFYRTWSGTEWSDETPLNGPDAPSQDIAIAQVSSDTLFGEASINLTKAGIILTDPNDPNFKCLAFSQAWVRSRASTAFTSEIKDIIKPVGVDIENCREVGLDNTAFASADNHAQVSSNLASILVGHEESASLSTAVASPAAATLVTAFVLPSSPAGVTATAAADPVISFAPAAQGGQADLHSVSPQVLDLVFSDLEEHERSSLEGDELGSALHELLHGLAG